MEVKIWFRDLITNLNNVSENNTTPDTELKTINNTSNIVPNSTTSPILPTDHLNYDPYATPRAFYKCYS